MDSQDRHRSQSLFIRNEQFGCRRRQVRTGRVLVIALSSLVVLLVLPDSSFAQSALTDDAQTSTAPKSTDSNFGTNPNLSVSAAGNVYLKFKLSSTLPAYKTGIQHYLGGLDVAKRLNPITFAWKDDGRRDIGFGAEDVAKVEPLQPSTMKKVRSKACTTRK